MKPKSLIKPCDEPCRKCGGKDIHRQHRRAGEKWHATSENGEPFSSFINVDNWTREATRECITHHCRTCQYDWQTKPLSK